jgi:Protein of unknown function (DUF2971)
MKVPQTLFKYLPPARIDVLEKSLIRFTQPGDLNDPFEFRSLFRNVVTEEELSSLENQIIDREVQKILPSFPKQQRALMAQAAKKSIRPQVENALNDVLQQLNNEHFPKAANSTVGVLSLSEDPLSLLMWSHYAHSHQGFVLEFDTNSELFLPPPGVHKEFSGPHKVLYSTKRLTIDLDNSDLAINFLRTKPAEWSYEKEWRLLRPLNKKDHIAHNPSSPFDIHLYKIPIGTIRSVLVGDRMSKVDFERISETLSTFSNNTKIRLFGVRMHESEFALERFEVDNWNELQTDERRALLAKQNLQARMR